MQIVEKMTKEKSCWGLWNNCSVFAADIWNEALDDNLSNKSLLFTWPCPSALMNGMQERSEYKKDVSSQATLPF
jgi:hypothetical protein